MACTNCSTKNSNSGTPRGCKSNGTCGTDSCNKLTVFDWLSNMQYPTGFEPFDVVEVRFKNGRKDFYKNTEKLSLSIGDIVATEASPGHDIGIVTLTGELVRVQMKKKKVNPEEDLLKLYRKASQKDIDIWTEAREREEPMKVRARELAIKLQLEMKISDIEFQGDASKATFYYTANDRVDFRQLIKDFAKEFSIRIEMKQVGFRQEASRLGGIGSCGRELCCSTWLTDFRSVNTSAARYQQLSLNPQKLAGQCGKLKCCLNYELDTYLDALKGIPDADTKIYTENGEAICQKTDIFKGTMWFAYTSNFANWIPLKVEDVKEIIEINKEGKKISSLEDYTEETPAKDKIFENAVGEDNLSRFDQPKKKKRPIKKKKTNTVEAEVVNQETPKTENITKQNIKKRTDNRPKQESKIQNNNNKGLPKNNPEQKQKPKVEARERAPKQVESDSQPTTNAKTKSKNKPFRPKKNDNPDTK
nr:regulatory iron-sulfur-containing complex subunit RicT [uncultured Flavobacterium sp.]